MLSELNEKCAVFAIYDPGMDVARSTYYGLYALQHRGQESSGIVTTDGKRFYHHHGQGLVAHVYQEENLAKLPGIMALGHNRYSTSGGIAGAHLQPVYHHTGLSFAHNGNLPSTAKLTEFLEQRSYAHDGMNDSEMMACAISHYLAQGDDLAGAVERCYGLFTGAFSCVAMTKDQIVAFRDRCGIRPLSIAKIESGWVVASETCAFDTIGAALLRDIRPGEMAVISPEGLRFKQLAQADPKLDVFEFVYFARPDSMIAGQRVGIVRRAFGYQMAKEHPLDADVVIPMPDSAIPAALGYAQETGIPYDYGLIKNRYIHRTFIRPSERLRQHDLQMKLNPVPEVLMGKRVVLVDDSIVRGTTLRKVVKMLHGAGAKTVSVVISSPPVMYPDFYGIDTPKQDSLVAANKSVEDIREELGCDYLGYLSLEGMLEATGLPPAELSTSCFTGEYPIDILERAQEVRHPAHA